MGAIVLRTVVYLSQIVASLAVTVENDPQLLAKLQGSESQDTFQRPNLVENAANVVREGFIKCLSDRGGTANQQGKPEGKRAGIYLMVNQCLKLLHKVKCVSLPYQGQLIDISIEWKAPQCRYNIQKHCRPIASARTLSGCAASDLPLLSWAIPIRKWPFLSCPEGSVGSLHGMPRGLRQTQAPYLDPPHFVQYHHGPISFYPTFTEARGMGSLRHVRSAVSAHSLWRLPVLSGLLQIGNAYCSMVPQDGDIISDAQSL